MAKKIMQKHLSYTVPGSGNDATDASYMNINFCKDLSLTNRQNITQTDRKGVPKIYGFKITATGSVIAKSTVSDEALSDDDVSSSLLTMRFYAPMSNWVMRNGAVKTHVAREKMFEKGVVDPSSRGAYSHTIRYALESGSESYLTPVSTTARSAFTGGTWDISQLVWERDTGGAHLCLTTAHNTEGSNTTFTNLCMPQMYLASRQGKIDDDTNEDSFLASAYSVINQLMTDDTTEAQDEVIALAKGEQDNPPYDRTNNGDWTDLIEVGRIQFNPYTGGMASTFIEVPFGVCRIQAQLLNHSDGDADYSVDLNATLVKVGAM